MKSIKNIACVFYYIFFWSNFRFHCNCLVVNVGYSSPFSTLGSYGNNEENTNSFNYLRNGYSFTLTCEYLDLNEDSFDYLRWTRFSDNDSPTGTQIYHSNNANDLDLEVEEDGATTHVTILSFDSDRDLALYQCIVCDTNFDCESNTLTINSTYVVVEPTVNISCSTQSFTVIQGQGDSTVLTCTASGGYPEQPINYTWMFIPRYPNSTVQYESSGSAWQIDDVTHEHFGSYTCLVDVIGGQFSASKTLEVHYPPFIFDESPFILLTSVGNSVTFNTTFRAFPRDNVAITWSIVNNLGTYYFEEDAVTTLELSAEDTYSSIATINRVRPQDLGTVQCHISNGVQPDSIRYFTLAIGTPEFNQRTLTYKRTGNVAILSWSLPSGFYTNIAIDQCFNQTAEAHHQATSSSVSSDTVIECVEYIITDDSRSIDIEETNQNSRHSYKYYMVVYQYGYIVARSEAFAFISGSDSGSSSYILIAALTAVAIVVVVIGMPLLLLYIFDCECFEDKNAPQDVNGFRRILRRFRSSKKTTNAKKEEPSTSITSVTEESKNSKDVTLETENELQTNETAKNVTSNATQPTKVKVIAVQSRPEPIHKNITNDDVRKLAATIKTQNFVKANNIPKQPQMSGSNAGRNVPKANLKTQGVKSLVQKKSLSNSNSLKVDTGDLKQQKRMTPVLEIDTSLENTLDDVEDSNAENEDIQDHKLVFASYKTPENDRKGKQVANSINTKAGNSQESFSSRSDTHNLDSRESSVVTCIRNNEGTNRSSTMKILIQSASRTTFSDSILTEDADDFSYVQKQTEKLEEEDKRRDKRNQSRTNAADEHLRRLNEAHKGSKTDEIVHSWDCESYDLDTDSDKVHVYEL